MSVENIFNMNGSSDECSYATNSSYQRKVSAMVDRVTTKVIVDFYLQERPECLKIADLGCSTGPNSVSLIGKIIHEIDRSCSKASLKVPEIQVFLNDLPTNDFNSIFANIPTYIRSLSKDGTRDGSSSVFVAGVAGSFYGKLFPSNSLHFVHSSYCLHWLSQIPPGLFDENGKPKEKGKVYISQQGSESVLTAYLTQFQKDFTLFLKSRSSEIVSGGKMLLILLGRKTDLHDETTKFPWDVLDEAFKIAVSKGEIDEEKADAYKIHFYAPSMSEVREQVKEEGSFVIDKFDMFETSSETDATNALDFSNTMRNIQESMLIHHFGEGINVGNLFKIYLELVEKLDTEFPVTNFFVVLKN